MKITKKIVIVLCLFACVLVCVLLLNNCIHGMRTPYEYTYDEYKDLSASEATEFIEQFDTYEDFLQWEKHQLDIESGINMPWTSGGKLPNEYTYMEFASLTDEQKEYFYNWFISHEAYLKWEEKCE